MGRAGSSRLASLGGIATITLLLAIAAVLVALPLRDRRERRMNDAARRQLHAVMDAMEEFRGQHYRLPESLQELESFGFAAGPSIEVCAFRRFPDRRRFDDHVRFALRHRASSTALVARYPQAGQPVVETPASVACERNASSMAASGGG